MTENSLTCLLMYHRDDRAKAEWLKRILEENSIVCKLLYDVTGANIYKDAFDCAKNADCVISLITRTLFNDETCRMLHEKVYWHLVGEKFVAVKMFIAEEMYNSSAGCFLVGCHVLAPEEMTDLTFRECLVNEIHAVVHRNPSSNKQQFSFKADIEPYISTYSKKLNKAVIYDNAILANNLACPETIAEDVLELFLSPDTPEILKDFEKCREYYAEVQRLKDSASRKDFVVDSLLPKIKSAIQISLRDKQLSYEPDNQQNLSRTTTNNSSLQDMEEFEATKDDGIRQILLQLEVGGRKEGKFPVACSSYDGRNSRKENDTSFMSITAQEDHSQTPSLRCSFLIPEMTIEKQSSTAPQEDQQLILLTQAYQSLNKKYHIPEQISYTAASKNGTETHALLKPLIDAARDSSYFETTWEGKSIQVVKEVIVGKPPNQFLKFPFVLPMLSTEDLSRGLIQVTYPYIYRNLGQLLTSANTNIQAKVAEPLTWRQYLPIIYQVSGALEFLHNRSVVHGSVNPNNILIDEHGNARLGGCGLKRDSALSVCLSRSDSTDEDISKFGITILQILKCTNDRESVELLAHEELPEAATMAYDKRYIEDKQWKLGDEVTRRLCEISLQCLRKSQISQIKADTKDLITSQKLPLITFPGESCVYCMSGTPKQGLRARSSNCPEKCTFLRICPSCMPSVCRSEICCPDHDTQIFPPIGGTKSFALIVTGRDVKDDETQQVFYKDCHEMELAIAHPHIMAVPLDNIYRISPGENNTEEAIVRVLEKIVNQKPDFFLLYFSGHTNAEGNDSRLDVSNKQGNALNVANLHRSLRPLLNTCSRLLVIPDCCKAASLGSLVQSEQYTNDSHITFHTTWSSCGRNELSNMQPYEAHSLFTNCLVAGLKGGRKCPNGVLSCAQCQYFRKEIEDCRCISKKTIEEYVNVHMRCKFQEGRDDLQGPIVVESRRDSDPVIAYFRSQTLYRFHYESPRGQNNVDKICELDSLKYNVDEVLECLWNQLKEDSLPNQLDHRCLHILCRKSDGRVCELNEVNEIIMAVFQDADSLFVSIRTNGENLDVNKWVACFCDVSQTKDTVHSLLQLERNRCQTEERGGVKKVSVREIHKQWKAADNSAFDETLQKCWDSFLSRKQQNRDSFLQIEIHEKLSMFNIVT